MSKSKVSAPIEIPVVEVEKFHRSAVKKKNFETLVSTIQKVSDSAQSRKLLDVGCSVGVFLDVAKRFGYQTFGIEPVEDLYEKAVGRGHQVLHGLFPDALPAGAKFDVIVFNDVFEHIEDSDKVLSACHSYLNSGGVLVLNYPNSQGVFFWMASLMERAGISSPSGRLWQVESASPHLHYFQPRNLKSICARNGFRELQRHSLQTLSIDGLWSRLRVDTSKGILQHAITFLLVVAAAPLLRWLPNDICVQYFQRME